MLAWPETLMAAKTWLDAGLSFFYPNICQYCEEEPATKAQGFVGSICQKKVKLIERPFCERCGLPFPGEITTSFECSNCRDLDLCFSIARSAALAEGMVLDLIHRYKYSRALWLEPFLAGLLVSRAVTELRPDEWGMFFPVPPHPT